MVPTPTCFCAISPAVSPTASSSPTDGHNPYLEAVEAVFHGQIDYAMLIKEYGQDPSEERRFSPPVVLAERVKVISGFPDETKMSTS